MKFDVIIGNPPYQLSTAGDENGAQAKPLYHKFVEQAKKLNPSFLTMIIPSRWFAGGWGLEEFRQDMMTDRHISEIHDFANASDCFPGVEIKGGVCYFLRDRSYSGDCKFVSHSSNEVVSTAVRPLKEDNCEILIRYNEAIEILHKVKSLNEDTFDKLVSAGKPFGFKTNYKGPSDTPFKNCIKLYANRRVEYAYKDQVLKNADAVSKYKIIVPKAVGSGEAETDRIKPILCEPGSCCTETYLMVGPFEDKDTCENVISYFNTKFFHFLVTLQKNTQDCMRRVYSFVPIQDFSKKWTDQMLYNKYNLTTEEISYIENMVWPDQQGTE